MCARAVSKSFDQGNDSIKLKIDGVRQSAHHTWFRGDHCNFNPAMQNMRKTDSVEKFILQGWAPETPLIAPSTKVVAFGSCFAANITKWLASRDFSVLTKKEDNASSSYVVRFGEGMVNTFVILQQFEWALENRQPEGDLWHGYDANAFGYDEQVRQDTRDMFMAADVFIITLGLSEIWYDEQTGGVFWRAVPQDHYDPSRHKFRVSSVDENRRNIRAIYDIIRRHRPDAKVIFTLSPIPLVATFRPNSCMTSNSVSKSILRAALDEALREINEPQVAFYWPSFEIVMDVFSDRWMPDRRHVKPKVLDFIMSLFMKTWCKDYVDDIPLVERWLLAQAATGALSKKLVKAFMTDDAATIKATLATMKKNFAAGAKVFQEDIDLIEEACASYAQREPKSQIAALLAKG